MLVVKFLILVSYFLPKKPDKFCPIYFLWLFHNSSLVHRSLLKMNALRSEKSLAIAVRLRNKSKSLTGKNTSVLWKISKSLFCKNDKNAIHLHLHSLFINLSKYVMMRKCFLLIFLFFSFNFYSQRNRVNEVVLSWILFAHIYTKFF